MRELGFKPTIGSGSGWIEKEDGQTETTIAQLKSTDAASISLKLLDMQRLEENAIVTNKRPIFVLQFLKTNDVFLVVRPSEDILAAIHAGQEVTCIELADGSDDTLEPIKAGHSSRDKFHEQREVTQSERAAQSKADSKVRRSQRKEKPKRILEP